MRTLRQRDRLLLPLVLLGRWTSARTVATLSILGLPGLLTLPLVSARATAQEVGTLKGTIATTEKKPLPQARIGVAGTALAALADSDGAFRITGLPIGGQNVEVKLLGYATVLVPVQIQAGKDASVEVLLVALPVALPSVKVTADTLLLPEMRRFAERRSRGSGKFFTRADIDHMEARLFTDILRRVPGMQLEPQEGVFGPTMSIQSTRNQGVNGGRGCPMLFYVNGVPLQNVSGMAINAFVSAGEVAAVEVYTGASQVPSEFSNGMSNARCGVVVIWTRITTSPSRSN